MANALADNLPAPKQPSSKSRRRRRKKKRKVEETQAQRRHSPNGRPDEKQAQELTVPAVPAAEAVEKTA